MVRIVIKKPTDGDIPTADVVHLIDPTRKWSCQIGSLSPSSVDAKAVSAKSITVLEISVDSSNADEVRQWMERIERLRPTR
ncbi:MAG: hypothetical protein SH850_22130 [Planctomycetaceae bacterium]|nr:hypothetical protein [Planctomycetaceae bacterium]